MKNSSIFAFRKVPFRNSRRHKVEHQWCTFCVNYRQKRNDKFIFEQATLPFHIIGFRRSKVKMLFALSF